MKTTLRLISCVIAFIVMSLPSRVAAQQAQTIRDEDIRVMNFEELRYPLSARLSHVQGIVVVQVTLDDNGSVVDAAAISGAKSLISDSITNVKKWRFHPNAQKKAVIVYQFLIDSGLCHGVAASHFVFRPPNFASITSCESVAEP
jgi:hypothetical protein